MTQVPVAVESVLAREMEALRRPLLGFCYRMLGSSYDAEDAVQETMIRAWRAMGRLDDPAGLRPWIYKIATNVCIDAATDRRRRAMPMDLAAPDDGRGSPGAPLAESLWLSPIPTGKVDADDPAERALSRESIQLAFVAALQHLLPRQRAVLILRDVLRFRAAEVAALLETSVDAVHSSLRRARASLAEARRGDAAPLAGHEPVDARLLRRYVEAFERFDVDAIVSLLRHDVVVSMPPFSFWLHGQDAFRLWLENNVVACDHARLILTDANGSPAAALYRAGPTGALERSGLQVLHWRDGKIASLHVFLQPALLEQFGLPQILPQASTGPQLEESTGTGGGQRLA